MITSRDAASRASKTINCPYPPPPRAARDASRSVVASRFHIALCIARYKRSYSAPARSQLLSLFITFSCMLAHHSFLS